MRQLLPVVNYKKEDNKHERKLVKSIAFSIEPALLSDQDDSSRGLSEKHPETTDRSNTRTRGFGSHLTLVLVPAVSVFPERLDKGVRERETNVLYYFCAPHVLCSNREFSCDSRGQSIAIKNTNS